MDIDEFLENETSKLGGKARIISKSDTGSDRRKKNQDSNIFSNIAQLKQHLKNDVTVAISEFDYLKNRYADMTKKQFSQNRFIFNELLSANNEIIKKIESMRSDTQKKIMMIDRLLRDAQMKLDSGEVTTANKLYIEIKEIIKQIPDIFLEEKQDISNRVTLFSVSLSTKLQEESSRLFAVKKNELENAIREAYDYMSLHDGQIHKGTYERVNSLFMSLPEGHVYEKALLYNDTLKLFRTSFLADETKEVMSIIGSNPVSSVRSAPSVPQEVPVQPDVQGSNEQFPPAQPGGEGEFQSSPVSQEVPVQPDVQGSYEQFPPAIAGEHYQNPPKEERIEISPLDTPAEGINKPFGDDDLSAYQDRSYSGPTKPQFNLEDDMETSRK